MSGYQIGVPFLTPMVKRLIIINVAIWVFGIVILQNMVLGSQVFYQWFGLIPNAVIKDFYVWQVFTYMFFALTKRIPCSFQYAFFVVHGKRA